MWTEVTAGHGPRTVRNAFVWLLMFVTITYSYFIYMYHTNIPLIVYVVLNAFMASKLEIISNEKILFFFSFQMKRKNRIDTKTGTRLRWSTIVFEIAYGQTDW